MLELIQNTTWTQYLAAAAGVAVLYYLMVILFFNGQVLWKGFKEKNETTQALQAVQANEDLDPAEGLEMADELEVTVGDIGTSILFPGSTATKEEILTELKERVSTFSGLGRAGYRYALNNYIIEKAKENCGVDFSEEDLERAWTSLPR